MPISATDLNKAYLAYFGRPADLTGKTYFATLEQADVIKAFDASAESKALYGNDAAAKVNAIYQNLFNRDAEPEGLVYWTTLINQGRVTAAGAAFAILNGAQGTDATAVQNKLAASEAFVAAMDTTSELVGYSGMDAAASARNWLKAVGADAATLTTAVAGAQAAVTAAVAAGTGEGGAGFQLTNGTDVASANVFTAGLVYTPGGDDRINSLQDEDRLTGTGTNATLNATLGIANDNGGTMITPTLVNINTVNAAFTGSGGGVGGRVNTLDLQDATGVDAVNITRISQGFGATVQNITSAASQLSVKNTQAAAGNNVAFTFLASALAGTADSTTLTVSNVTIGAGSALVVEQNGLNNNGNPLAAQGFETINLVSAGSANNIAQFQAEDLRTLNISGAENLTIGQFNNAAGSLTLIDGATATGNLDLNLNGVLSAGADGTSGTNVALTVRTGTGTDTIRITDDTIGATDSIDAGEGSDTVVLRATEAQNFTPATTGAALVSNVENLSVNRIVDGAGAATARTLVVDMARFAGDQVTTLSNLGDAGDDTTFVLANASAGDAAGLRITHGSTGNNALGDNTIVLDVDTGVTTAGVEIREGVNTEPRFNFSLNADSNLTFTAAGGIASGGADVTNSVVNITLTDSDSESNSVALTQAARHTGVLDVNAGTAGTFLNLDTVGTGYTHNLTGAVGDATVTAAATLEARDAAVARVFTQGSVGTNLAFTSVTAADFAGNLEFRLGTTNTNAQLGSGDDTVIFADRTGISAATAGLTIQDTIAGGAGTDTIVLDGTGVQTLGASEWTNLSGVDVVRLAGVAGGTFNIRVTDQLVDQTDAGDRLTIVNNDGDLRTQTELTANIDLRALSAANSVTFVGNNANGTAGVGTVQTLILNDVTANGNNILNGGDSNVVSEYVANGRNAAGGAGAVFATQVAADAQYAIDVGAGLTDNNNVLRIFNTAEVTVGDLANTSNFSTINFVNDQASVQTLNLTLNDAVVDALANASHTATATQREAITITATDNALVAGASAVLNVDARQVIGFYALNVTGSATGNDVLTLNSNLGGATTTAALGASAGDRVNWTGGSVSMNVTIDLGADGNAGGVAAGNGFARFVDAAVTTTHDIDNADIVDLTGLVYATSVIHGTAAAKTVIAGGGADTLSFAVGQAGTYVFADVVADANVTNTDTFTGNFDVIQGFSSGMDKLDLPAGVFSYLGNAYVTSGVGGTYYNPISTHAFFVRGDYVGSVFTVNTLAGRDTLVFYDVAGTNEAIVLAGITNFVPGTDLI